MSPFVWLLVPVIVTAGFVFARWTASGDRGIRAALRGHREVSLEDVQPPGLARVSARVAEQEPELIAPFSKSTCVAWTVQLQRRRRGLYGGPSPMVGWELVGESFDASEFIICSGVERATVEAEAIEVALPMKKRPKGLAGSNEALQTALEDHGQSLGTQQLYEYRVLEGCLRPGDTLSVLAQVERDADGRLRLAAPKGGSVHLVGQ